MADYLPSGKENPELPTLPVGAFVQVKDEALQGGIGYSKQNRNTVTEHGYLWFVEGITPNYQCDDNNLYSCRSMKTGGAGYWFPFEVNIMEANDG